MAGVIDPEGIPDARVIGIENHLNVFHVKKAGIPRELAYGLSAFPNSDSVDERFRRFSGHTQVNAADLRRMKYPSRESLIERGKQVLRQKRPAVAAITEERGSNHE